MSENKQENFMMRVAAFIVDKRLFFFAFFIAFAVFAAFSSGWVELKDLLTDYLRG